MRVASNNAPSLGGQEAGCQAGYAGL